MEKFEEQFNYYLNLYSTIPEEYSVFGNFGEACWLSEINEGLITSYPKNKVIKYLFNLDWGGVELEFSSFQSTSTIDIYVTLDSNYTDIEEFENSLNNDLNVYGYFIGKISPKNAYNQYPIIIEPKYPLLLSDEDKIESPLYHITYDFYLPKINKVGLTPRESTTVFSHPGGRIYLIQTRQLNLLDLLKKRLSQSKIETAQLRGIKNIERFKSENMVVLEVEPSGKLFLDPMFPTSKSYNAVFITENIGPEHIKLTKY
jgi:hypothetical protein